MSSKKAQQKKKTTPQAAGKFDDALPEKLLFVASPDAARTIPIRRDNAVSPYIVKLRKGMGDVHASRTARALGATTPFALEIDTDDDAVGTAPETLATFLGIDPGELREQLVENDYAPLDRNATHTKTRFEDTAIPALFLVDDCLDPSLDVDVRAELAPDVSPSPFDAPRTPRISLETALRTLDEDESASEERDEIIDAVRAPFARAARAWPAFFGPRFRAVVAFVAIAVIVTAPLHVMLALGGATANETVITDAGKAALDDFTRGATALADKRFTLAKDDFSRAAERFSAAQASLDAMRGVVAAAVSVIPQTDRTVDAAHNLVTAGKELSAAASIMTDAADGVAGTTSLSLVDKLNVLASYVLSAEPHATVAAQALRNVDPNVVPDAYRDSVVLLQAKAPQVADAMSEFLTFVNGLSVMLGGNSTMRYLTAFENNTEIRPTGGFVGSYAEVDLKGGAIEKLAIPGGGIYSAQGQLQKFVAAPGPLQIVSARWEFQDANWFPDFPTSAKKMQWFYEKSGGPTTDGVLAVNATFMVDLLSILGPVDMPQYGLTLNAENFLFETQKQVEVGYDKTENEPKAIIRDMAPVLLDRVAKADLPTLLSVLHLVETGLRQKDILVSFNDNDVQAMAENFGWTGSLKQTRGDYLMVVDTNIGGGKTDGVIDQDVNVDVTVEDDGSVVDTVTFTKTHKGLASALFSGVNNVDYVRLYVPEGSELLSASGFKEPSADAYEEPTMPLAQDDDLAALVTNFRKDAATGTDVWNESGKTVFGGFMQTMPGTTETLTFSYRVPLSVFADSGDTGLLGQAKRSLGLGSVAPYSLFIQKMPGVTTRTTHVTLSLPNFVSPVWTSFSPTSEGSVPANTNAEDVFSGWLFAKR